VGRVLRTLAAIGLALLFCASPAGAGSTALDAAEERGREIYFTGASPSGEAIEAEMGEAGSRVELPGEAATCGGCHGHDGKGRPESGVLPANITWSHLTRSYGHLHPSGLEHGPFDDASLAAYLRTGVFPGGGRGDPSMPTYRIPDPDLADLLAYLKRVGEIRDPGLGDTAIRIGTLVPGTGPLSEIGAVIRDVVGASFREVNAAGGLYGRRLELVVGEMPAGGFDRKALEAWLLEAQPFALVGAFAPRAELELQEAISRQGVPLIGPFSLQSLRSFALNRQVFYLYPGLGEQLDALLHFADTRLGLSDPQLAVLAPDDGSLDAVMPALEKAGKKRGWPGIHNEAFPPGGLDAAGAAARLQEAGVEVVVSLGAEPELDAFLTAAAARSWAPVVLAIGALSGGALFEVPEGFQDRLYLAYPTLPQDRKPWALKDLSRLMAGNQRARAHVQAVVSSYSAVRILVEGLRRAGRDLGRRELTAELERFYRFETGLTPPITYTANRRIGARGAYILGPGSLVEGRLPASVAWVDAD
jgi:ABC-type branched-subunit amino acid transport system substrate-binding protein